MKKVSSVPGWECAQCMHEFMHLKVRTLSLERQAVYQRWLKEFVHYCCITLECVPKEIDFGNCTALRIQGREYKEQISVEFVRGFLNTVSHVRSRYNAEVVIRAYFDVLLRRGIIYKNPVPKIPHPERKSPPKQGLSIDDIHRFIGVLRTWPMPYRAAITLQLAGGLRGGELCALRTNDMDSDWNVYIRREVLKNKWEYKIPVPYLPETVKSYSEWREINHIDSEYLFVDVEGKPMKLRTLNQQVSLIGEQAGCLRRVTSHDMRRAFATLMSKFQVTDALHQVLRNTPQIAWGYVLKPSLDEISNALEKLPAVKLAESFAIKLLDSDIDV